MSHESRNRRDMELQCSDPDCMVLAPVPQSRLQQWTGWLLVGLMIAVLVGLITFAGFLAFRSLVAGGWWLIAAAVCIFVGLAFVYILGLLAKSIFFGPGDRRFRFDRAAKQLIIDRPFGVRKEYRTEATHALSTIIALQLLYSGYHHISHTSDHGTTTDDQFFTYEMNLLFDGAEPSREHLTTHSDWQWMRQVGEKLAAFLSVPVVDQLFHGD